MDFLVAPWAHQLEAFNRSRNLDYFGLFFEQGCGKTPTAINWCRWKYAQAGELLTTLVLCPPIVVENWRREWLRFSRVGKRKVVALAGSGKDRLAQLEEAGQGKIIITNYESLLMPELFKALVSLRPRIFICDESHKCKNREAKRTKRAIELAAVADMRLIMSGTPLLNGPEDIFTQFLVLDRGETFGKNYFAFRAKYFYDENAGMPKASYFPAWVPRPDSFKRINDLIYRNAMRVTKAEAMDLPPLVRQLRYVSMTPEQARVYKSMEEDYIAFLESEACVGELAITRGLRLQEIVSGYCKLQDGTIKRFKENPRLDALEELLVDLTPDHKIIVWAVFSQNYADIRGLLNKLKIPFVEITGEVSDSKKKEAEREFNTNPAVRVLLGNQRAGGIGINLVVSDIAIYYSRNFSLEDDDQSAARNHRGGSEIHEKVTRIDLVVADTLDETTLTALSEKKNISEAILSTYREKRERASGPQSGVGHGGKADERRDRDGSGPALCGHSR